MAGWNRGIRSRRNPTIASESLESSTTGHGTHWKLQSIRDQATSQKLQTSAQETCAKIPRGREQLISRPPQDRID